MSIAQFEIQLIAVVVALACALPGVFLVLRKMSMISDAISHSILPGIVLGFFATQDLSSPLLILMAALAGILTVVLVESINHTGLVKEDTAIGLVFPAMFSIGVLLISRNANDIHLDTDAVLLGELAFAPFNRYMPGGIDLGPKSLWVMGLILICSVTVLVLFYKELKISTFDKELSTSLGFSPILIHYLLMSMTSITTVGAFDAVGAVLVVALMIVPAASAYLLTDNLKKMIWIACTIGAISALSGYWLANLLDASISGSITTNLGVIFLFIYFFAPGKGLLAVIIRQIQQKNEFSLVTFLLHIKNHSREGSDPSERLPIHLTQHFKWSRIQSERIIDLALKNNMIELNNGFVALSQKGIEFTEEALDYIVNNKKSDLESMKGRFLLFRG